MKKYTNYPLKKCKNFGHTFAIIFLLLSVYFIIVNRNFIIFFSLSLTLTLISIFFPKVLQLPGFYWEKFGYFLGTIFSPIILFFIYVITIIPINLIIRVLKIDLLKKKKCASSKTYWQNRNNNKIDFTQQF
jgi:uncharacterized membrane protein